MLLSPLEFADFDEWRREANHRLRALTGADKAVFFLPGHGAWCDELDPSAHAEYEAHFHRLDRGATLSLTRGLSVASHSQLYDKDEFLRSEWYNDFLVPYRCFGTLGLTVEVAEATPPWSFVALQGERREMRPFGRRVRAHLELVAAAFRAGVETALGAVVWRDALAASLDRVADRLAVYDRRARVVHRNVALRETLKGEPERRRVRHAMESAARSAASPEAGGLPRRSVRTERGSYLVRAFRASEGFRGPVVVVALEPRFPIPIGNADLEERFALTPREIQVARWISAGESNAAIADTLGISPHTARRHTEAILRKLGIASRAQVLERITR